jgi:hypothetical protein
VEIYGRIRRAVLVEGRSQRSVAREFGLARVTVRKMLGYSIPPGYRLEQERSTHSEGIGLTGSGTSEITVLELRTVPITKVGDLLTMRNAAKRLGGE